MFSPLVKGYFCFRSKSNEKFDGPGILAIHIAVSNFHIYILADAVDAISCVFCANGSNNKKKTIHTACHMHCIHAQRPGRFSVQQLATAMSHVVI